MVYQLVKLIANLETPLSACVKSLIAIYVIAFEALNPMDSQSSEEVSSANMFCNFLSLIINSCISGSKLHPLYTGPVLYGQKHLFLYCLHTTQRPLHPRKEKRKKEERRTSMLSKYQYLQPWSSGFMYCDYMSGEVGVQLIVSKLDADVYVCRGLT